MCRRWVDAGHEVTVITSAPNVPNGKVYDGYKNRLYQTEQVDGINVIRVWTYIAPNEGTVKRIANYVSYMLMATFAALFQRSPDVLIATSPQFFCGWAGALVSWLKRIPFVLEIRDIWPESITAVGAMQNKRLVGLLEWLELKLYGSSDRIVTVGEGYRQRLLEKQVEATRISVVTNGVDEALFTPRKKDLKLVDRHGLDGKFICSYVGTIGMACGLEVVIEAAEMLQDRVIQDIHFLLVGDGANREGLANEVSARGLDSAITFAGRQPKELIPNYLATSDVCLVHLRKTDLFTTVLPSKIFEAAGMERPIINGVPGQAKKIVEAANAGLSIEPENPEELVEALLALKNDPAVARGYGRAGGKFVRKNFNRVALAEDYLSILKEAALKKP